MTHVYLSSSHCQAGTILATTLSKSISAFSLRLTIVKRASGDGGSLLQRPALSLASQWIADIGCNLNYFYRPVRILSYEIDHYRRRC